MRDSKLKSKDLIQIRQGLGGGSKATTQTARIARKLAEKTLKRNRITASVKRTVLDPEMEFGSDTYHKVTIKKGGIPQVEGNITFEKGLYPDLEDGKYAKGSGWARVSRAKKAELDAKSLTGRATRDPAALQITGIKPAGLKVDPQGGYGWDKAHKDYANKVMKPNDLKRGIKEIGKRFPSANKIAGWRITGRRDKLIKEFETKHPTIVKQGGLDSQSHINIRVQSINLPKPPKSSKPIFRPNATKLKGAFKKIRAKKYGAAAPIEAAFTSYATGGGVEGAATAAASTTAFGAGIRASLKKAGAVAAKHAPGLIKVAGKAAVPLAVASAGYDLFRVGQEGYRAHEAATDARRNEAYMNENYGSIEAATRTRHNRRTQ